MVATASGPHRGLRQRAHAGNRSCGCPTPGPAPPAAAVDRTPPSASRCPTGDRGSSAPSARRSAIEARAPRTTPNTWPAASRSPSSADHDTSTVGSTWGTSRTRTECRPTWPPSRAAKRASASVAGQQRGGQVAERVQVLGQGAADRIGHDVGRGMQPGRGFDGAECRTAGRVSDDTSRCRWALSVSEKSDRAWVPRDSVRSSAALTSTRPIWARLSHLGRRQPLVSGSPPLARDRVGQGRGDHRRAHRVEALGRSHHAGVGAHRPLEAGPQGLGQFGRETYLREGTGRLGSAGRSSSTPPMTSQVSSSGPDSGARDIRRCATTARGPGTGRTARMAPVGCGPSTPSAIDSTARGPNTIPSSSEFEASRLAPCTPLQLVSPAAHKPGSDGRTVQVGDDAAALVVRGGRHRQQVDGRVEPGRRRGRRRSSGTARRSGRGRWHPATRSRSPARSSSPGSPATRRPGAGARRRSARRSASRSSAPWPRSASDSSGRGIRGWCSAVGWNWKNSRSATATPARMRHRDPVAGRGQRVGGDGEQLAGTAGGQQHVRARTAPAGAVGVEDLDADAPTVLDHEVDDEGVLLDQRRRTPHGVHERPLDLGARWRPHRRAPPGPRSALPRGRARGCPVRRGRTPRRGRSAPRPAAVPRRRAPGPPRRRTTRHRPPACRPGAGRSPRDRPTTRPRPRPGPIGWSPAPARSSSPRPSRRPWLLAARTAADSPATPLPSTSRSRSSVRDASAPDVRGDGVGARPDVVDQPGPAEAAPRRTAGRRIAPRRAARASPGRPPRRSRGRPGAATGSTSTIAARTASTSVSPAAIAAAPARSARFSTGAAARSLVARGRRSGSTGRGRRRRGRSGTRRPRPGSTGPAAIARITASCW